MPQNTEKRSAHLSLSSKTNRKLANHYKGNRIGCAQAHQNLWHLEATFISQGTTNPSLKVNTAHWDTQQGMIVIVTKWWAKCFLDIFPVSPQRQKYIGIVLDGVKKRKSNSSPAKEQIQFQSKKLRQTNRILGTETPSKNGKITSSTPQLTPLNKYEYGIGMSMSWINK